MPDHEPIAIIGSGCRLPGGASSPSKLWDILRKPRDLLRKIDIDRFNTNGFYHPDGRHHGTSNVQHAYLLEETFASSMLASLQRLLLETVYESLENAGIPLERLRGSDTAFYAGVMATDYTDTLTRDVDTFPQYFGTATARSILSNRVSYTFDWHGPSMTIDTACSSSMVALHLAVTSLRMGESKVAVAAGCNLILGPEIFIALSKLNMASPRGRSHMWDTGADGYGRGEGFVSVVLKPLADAIRDCDHIDCVIRESATNQDGRTKGITMPSAQAQAELIRKAYSNVGLDVRNPRDKPQFFEAHGTGTKAGDPQEAEAIWSSFFGAGGSVQQKHPLYVGGIKTVVGHTEGTAGLAGLLKTSLALQAGEIPPNLLFETLNPDLIPFYGPLEIPTKIRAWPELPSGVPKRASVNSFGFGGANTHVILESHIPPPDHDSGVWTDASPIIPFVFSAASEGALQGVLRSYHDYVVQHPDVNLSHLSWTLAARRSVLPVKVALSATSTANLLQEIGKILDSLEGTPDASIGIRSSAATGHRILGVFTGQGAQWAQMGKKLLDSVPRAGEIVAKLDSTLQNLPEEYRPSWSITDELCKDAATSRLSEAAFSQPLCTVVQIIVVDLLRLAGIKFSAVVGHSSGEIGAAYAAGFLSAEDATKVAYLRGLYAGLAQGPSGEKGAMMAVGCSMAEANELCNSAEFRGKMKLAASNSSSSVTLSGDSEAIKRAKAMLDEKKTFARLLKVDTAYHSHHMEPCADPYVKALDAAGVTALSPAADGDNCVWYSSVLEGVRMVPDEVIRGSYWRDNMVNTVLFSQAVTAAAQNGGPFTMALEVGPHPALKGPASQTLAELKVDIPYAGTLKRGESDLLAFSACLGTIWTNLGPSAVSLETLYSSLFPESRPTVLKKLPTYSWDHERAYWYESRKSERFRTRSQPPHLLLGSRVDDGTEDELRWRNFLSVHQIPWLEGHKIQGQMVLPAAGYVSMVFEAAQTMVTEMGHDFVHNVQLLQVEDLEITRAIVFSEDDKTGVETTTTLSGIHRDDTDQAVVATFIISAHVSQNASHLTKTASGKLRVVLGDSPATLPPRTRTPEHLIPIDTQRFYSSLETVGYGYTREFRKCTDMKRRLNFCTGSIDEVDDDSGLLIHPGVLDQVFQAMFGAFFSPGDGRFWTIFLPRTVQKIAVVPSLCRAEQQDQSKISFDAWLEDDSPSTEMRGDVAFFVGGKDEPFVQVEGASMVAVTQPTARDDRAMFFETVWGVAAPDGEIAVVENQQVRPSEADMGLTAFKCLAQMVKQIAHRHPRMNMIEVGAGTGSSTQAILDTVGNAYSSYTFTEASPDLLEKAASRFQDIAGDKMTFKVLDFEQPVADQGHGPHSYDVVIASKPIPPTADLTKTLSNIRSLLKSGGYLLLLGFTDNTAIRHAFSKSIGCARGVNSDHPHPPLLTPSGWNKALRAAGFSGVDTITPSWTGNCLSPKDPLSAMASQAVDAKMDQLRRPLLSPASMTVTSGRSGPESRTLHILGGGIQLDTSKIIDEVVASIVHVFDDIITIDTLDDIVEIPPNATVLNLLDLDEPVFEDLTPSRFRSLQLLIENTRTLLWVTYAQERENPWANASVGFLRSVAAEQPTLRAQVLDFAVSDKPLANSRVISEALVRLVIQDSWDKDPSFDQQQALLWTTEPEVRFKEGRLWIPRVVPHHENNDRLNVCRRNITRLWQPLEGDNETSVALHQKENGLWVLKQQYMPKLSSPGATESIAAKGDMVQIQVRYSSLYPVMIDPSSLVVSPIVAVGHLVTGSGNKGWLVALSADHSSTISVDRGLTVDLPETFAESDAPGLLKAVLSLVLADYIVDHTSGGEGTLLIHEPSQLLACVLLERSKTWKHKVRFVTTEERPNQSNDNSQHWIYLHPRQTAREIRKLLPRDVHAFVRFGNARGVRSNSTHVDKLIKAIIPANCRIIEPEQDVILSSMARDHSKQAPLMSPEGSLELGKRLTSLVGRSIAIVRSAPAITAGGRTVETVSLADLVSPSSQEHDKSGRDGKFNPLTLVKWTPSSELSLPIEISPPMPSSLFKPNKSYLLAGMTNSMGQSLCRWMIANGAGCVIMASRNPKISPIWIEEVEEISPNFSTGRGGKVKVFAVDLSSLSSIKSFATALGSDPDVPALGGVLNGIAILSDALFLSTPSVEQFNQAILSKVLSTIHLSTVFGNLDLDFFLLFSSLASIFGNRGQSNYNAANSFLTSFVQQRLAQGKPASAIQLGTVVGLGMLSRTENKDALTQLVDKYGYLPVSETDLFHIVGQAIVSGSDNAASVRDRRKGENADLITGMRFVVEGEESSQDIHWASNPRFGHLVLPSSEGGHRKKAGGDAVMSIRRQLADAASQEEAVRVLEAGFATKLRAMLRMHEESSSFRQDAPLIEMGVDSLVAVEIRSWFLKEVGVDIPVLRILGGSASTSTTTGLCRFAVESMPRELLPGIQDPTVAEAGPPEVVGQAGKPVVTGTPVASVSPEGNPTVQVEHTAPSLPSSSTSDSGDDSSFVHVQGQSKSSMAPSFITIGSTSGTASPPRSDTDAASSILEEKPMKLTKLKPTAAPEVIRRVRISSAQSRFWFLNQFLSDPTSSNITLSYNIRGSDKIRISGLAKALEQTANAHEALRTCFIPCNDKAWQGVMKTSKVILEQRTISTDEEAIAAYNEVRDTPYDLEQGETMRVVLLSYTTHTTKQTIIFGYHHIILDGAGFTAFLSDLEKAYATGQAPSPVGLAYSDFSEKEGIDIENGSLQENLAYWKTEFQDSAPPLLPLLPVARTTTRKTVTNYGSSYVEQRLDAELASKLKATCRKFHVTPAHFYLAVFRVMLARLAKVEDVCIGLADSNRHDSAVMSTVGLFLNMLPLRFKDPNLADTPFSETLKATRAKVYDGLGHAGVPFDELLQALKIPRSSGNSPLFQAFFDYHTGSQEKLTFADTTWENARRNPGERAYDLTLDILDGGAGSLVSLIGQEYLYDVSGTQKLLECYLSLLGDFVNNPTMPCSSANLFSATQIQEGLDLARGPRMTFEWSATLGHRVREICQKYPESVALRDGQAVSLSYRDLETKAQALHDELVERGVKPGDKVGVLQDATPSWICSVIAIFWAGGVYVPMVPFLNPIPRLEAIIQAAQPTAILVNGATADLGSQLQTLGASIVQVDHVLANASSLPSASDIPAMPVSGNDPAVILFTSGSTGTPKGIVLRHRNLVNHIEGYVKAWNIGCDEVVLQQSAFSFDLSIGQIFTALSQGGTLVVAPDNIRRDPGALINLMLGQKVTWTLLTPSEYSGLLQASPQELRQASSWKHALACGETLPRKLVRDFVNLGHPSVRLYNCYGPAEAIISATMTEVSLRDGDADNGPVSVGRPNPNYSIYIADEQGNPLPPGFPGEIVISGCGVGVGYLNEEDLTKAKFITSSQTLSDWDVEHGWTLSYRTGDMGRLGPDGMLMHEGRLEGDSQVKIRGFRVDLLDIESTMLNESNGIIADAVITLREEDEAQLLVAHVIFARSQELDNEEAAAYLRSLLGSLPLPAYMRPSLAVPVDKFPKNLHGKKDRKAIVKLPIPQFTSGSPDSADTCSEVDQTLSPVEKRLAEAWVEVLPAGLAQNIIIASNTDFFEVGGNSLLLVKLQAKIRNIFKVSLQLIKLLDTSVLSEMAALIETSQPVETVDWNKETSLDEDLLDKVSTHNTGHRPALAPVKQQGRVVLLTGATGYFGPYILGQLLSDPSIATIHCVAVRAESPSHAKNRVLQAMSTATTMTCPDTTMSMSSKIVIHPGDLGHPLLGLSEAVFAELTASVDLIIHSAARRSFWDSYYSLRDSNVLSTRTLLHLSAPRRVPVHFISTSGVLLLGPPESGAAPGSVSRFEPPVDGSNGYVATKWASEVLLERASRDLQIPVTVHRFTPRPDEAPRADDDETKAACLDDLVEATIGLGNVVPERSTWAGRTDLVRSEGLAKAIVDATVDDSKKTQFMHHEGQVTLWVDELFDLLEGRLEGKIESRMGLLEWVGAVKRQGYRWLFSTHDLILTRKEANGIRTVLVNQR
ncbi:hypothetical protein V8F20_010311 [Naviculisporaceae sp. PSN 640]